MLPFPPRQPVCQKSSPVWPHPAFQHRSPCGWPCGPECQGRGGWSRGGDRLQARAGRADVRHVQEPAAERLRAPGPGGSCLADGS